MIDISELKFGYNSDNLVVCIEKLTIEQGERVFLHGPSGCGKSTLLGLLSGIHTPISGSISVCGHRIDQLTQSKRDELRGHLYGYIFQMFNLIPYLSVKENIVLPLMLNRKRRSCVTEIDPEVQRLVNHLGISHALHTPVSKLSVGQQQRVAAARALLGSPKILVADEPTSSLDEYQRQNFIFLLLECAKKSDATIVFVSHDRSLKTFFDRVISLPEVNKVGKHP